MLHALLTYVYSIKEENYSADTLVHVVNIIARWPFMIRMIVRRNCSVNVSGGKGHNVAFDEFMEMFVVRPLKSYVSGKTTLKVLNAISGSLQLISCVRHVYQSKAAFDIHPTKKHSVAYALPDRLKVALFCLNNGFFKCDNSRKMIKCIKNEGFSVKQDFVSNDRISVFEKGKGKVLEAFDRRMYELFPERRNVFTSEN